MVNSTRRHFQLPSSLQVAPRTNLTGKVLARSLIIGRFAAASVCLPIEPLQVHCIIAHGLAPSTSSPPLPHPLAPAPEIASALINPSSASHSAVAALTRLHQSA
ncbi:hypothetical protein IF1G_06306 [Cordyceps javanica]|uniref:Uncharacterized protein n=1 Tax=Cordyceps javanica TaxID=43265 RepID=A0A545V0V7_9HYPO|nr:hypothetical protein IF1G_06306 [Cordyceps javanica]